jgi:hypothetical protein
MRATPLAVAGVLVGCFCIAGNGTRAQSPEGNLSPKDFDFVCALVTGAEMGASENEGNIPRRDMALTIFTFYLGRLSGRDDSKDWNAIVRGRAAEMQQRARSPKMLDSCEDFYISKIK